ncbi:MAG: hypothetical protein ACRCTX_20325 [Afipia sp.]
MQTIIELNGALVWTGAAQEIEAGAGVPDHWMPVETLPALAEGEYLIATGGGRYEIRSGTPPVPRVDKVTRRQFLQGLTRIGLRAPVMAWRTALDPADPADLDLIDWYDESQFFERQNPELLAVAAAFGLSDDQIDAAFAMMVTL